MSNFNGSSSKLQGIKNGKSSKRRNIVKSTMLCGCGKTIYKKEGRCAECYAEAMGVKLLSNSDQNQDEIYNLSVNLLY